MIQVKHFVDAERDGKSKIEARAHLLDFYDELPNTEDFDQVTKACFKERTRPKPASAEKGDKGKKEVFKKKYRSRGPPPPPPGAAASAS